MYSWSRHDVKPTRKTSFEEHVAGKQGQVQQFDSVLPILCRGVQRKKSFKSLGIEIARDYLFVLMLRVHGIPRTRLDLIVTRNGLRMHIALPCGLQCPPLLS